MLDFSPLDRQETAVVSLEAHHHVRLCERSGGVAHDIFHGMTDLLSAAFSKPTQSHPSPTPEKKCKTSFNPAYGTVINNALVENLCQFKFDSYSRSDSLVIAVSW